MSFWPPNNENPFRAYLNEQAPQTAENPTTYQDEPFSQSEDEYSDEGHELRQSSVMTEDEFQMPPSQPIVNSLAYLKNPPTIPPPVVEDELEEEPPAEPPTHPTKARITRMKEVDELLHPGQSSTQSEPVVQATPVVELFHQQQSSTQSEPESVAPPVPSQASFEERVRTRAYFLWLNGSENGPEADYLEAMAQETQD